MQFSFFFFVSSVSKIQIRGAREHNLCRLDVDIPREALTVITGVSGSGKSSLAFDTLYAEGYRKYIDSLSTRARQVLDQMKKPDVDYIHGLSPVIAIEQRTGEGMNPRSTVASVTEIADYARLLWSVQGEAHCPLDGGKIERRSLDDCLEQIFEETEGSRLMLLAPLEEAKPSVLREEIPRLMQKGFVRVRIDGDIRQLDERDLIDSKAKSLSLDVVVDRVVLREDQRSRIADSLELAFEEGEDTALVLVQANRESAWKEFRVSQHFSCSICGKVYEPLTPRHFSWNHPEGACSRCGGVGQTLEFVDELLVPDPNKSVKKGAIKPWRLGSKSMIIRHNALLKQLAEQLPFDPNVPWKELSEETRQILLHGAGERLFHFKTKPGNRKPEVLPWEGVVADLETIRRETTSDGLRAKLMAFQVSSRCEECKGQRLNALARNVTLEGLRFTDFLTQSTDEALNTVQKRLSGNQKTEHLAEAVSGLEQRLYFLKEVGLGYLTLDRKYNSLSGGEAQRVRLATQLGMGLVGVTYVLDEPSIGLHPLDNRRLIETLYSLRDRGNTVVVVEHDAEMMLAADHLLELGPGAGEQGGRLLFSGTPQEIQKSSASYTGDYLSGKLELERSYPVRRPCGEVIRVRGASENNLKQVDVSFPIGLLTVVCGVSGSGKSTLVNDILGQAAARKLNGAKALAGIHQKIEGLDQFDRVVRVDQEPIGRSPRSNPATYVKLFDLLRSLFSKCPLARVRGYQPSRFSFNMTGGRCERCKGDGVIRLDMQFLGDVFVECPSCRGKRYNRETLEVQYRGHNIADVLDLSISEAMELFEKHPRIQSKLSTLEEVGLGYLRLGQPAPTLSGGEAQRLKLSLELSKQQQGRSLYILDEPTTGLHWADIQKLMDLLFRLREAGNTILIIEHNLDVIRLADFLVEMGPEGGIAGGHCIYSGETETFENEGDTPTAHCLREYFSRI